VHHCIMNQIGTIRGKSEYSANDHLIITVDGRPLDHFISDFDDNGRHRYGGLVPTLLDWLENEDERKLVWTRILPTIGQTTIGPILMCPDDCNFLCTTVVAEIERTGKTIESKRIGTNVSPTNKSVDRMGQEVNWFPGLQFSFDLNDYLGFIERFKRELA
jgi:hypothetical protein